MVPSRFFAGLCFGFALITTSTARSKRSQASGEFSICGSGTLSEGFRAMFPSRKKFRFHVTPSDQQLWAIGMVAVQWTLLEGHIKVIAHGLYGNDAAARAEFDRMLVFRHRLRMVRDLIERKIMAPFKTDLLAIVDRMGSLAGERDKIIHGTWSSNKPLPPEMDVTPFNEATEVSGTAKPKPAFEWKLTFDRILDTALKIDTVSFDLMNYLASVVGKPPQFLMSDALKRISRKPDQNP